MARLIKLATAAAIVAAVSLAIIAGGYALFVVAAAQWGATVAAVVVALAALALAGAVALVWREIERRRETKASAPGLSDYLIDFALERPVTTALLGAAVGWICLRNPRLVALAAELMFAGRRERD